MGDVVYKICTRAAWDRAQACGRFTGSADDARDGFIHLSGGDQLAATAAKHFAGKADLVLLAVDVDRLDSALRWEPSRGGALYPHLYGALSLDAVLWMRPMPLGSDGTHDLPKRARM